jgi:hypothetical protein
MATALFALDLAQTAGQAPAPALPSFIHQPLEAAGASATSYQTVSLPAVVVHPLAEKVPPREPLWPGFVSEVRGLGSQLLGRGRHSDHRRRPTHHPAARWDL